jgi:acyl-CoA thioesterase
MQPPATARFDTDTAVTPLGGGTYAARLDRGWWIARGPNGGYIAAIVLQALTAEVGNPERQARSLTVHYLAPPAEGDVTIDVTLERAGRTASFASARLRQGDRLIALGLGAFLVDREAPSFTDATPPEVPPPELCPDLAALLSPVEIEMRDRYESRWAIGTPPGDGQAREAIAGGWIRLAESRPLDAPLLAAYADAWMPPVFLRLPEPNAVPTVDLTVHFRSPLPSPDVDDDDYVLTVFRTRVLAGGFLEEDGEIWSRNGVLLAQSRQLAVMLANE